MVVARAGHILAAPLRDWINRELEHHSVDELAARLGVDRRQLQRWRYEQPTPSTIQVDRALTRAGVHIVDVCGELLAIPEYDRRGTCKHCGAGLKTPAALCGFCELEQLQAAA